MFSVDGISIGTVGQGADITLLPTTVPAANVGWDETTAAMIAELTAERVAGKRVLDHGTGGGLLALVAAHRGASSLAVTEIDPDARALAERNFAANGVSVKWDAPGLFDVVAMNMDREPTYQEAAAWHGALLLCTVNGAVRTVQL